MQKIPKSTAVMLMLGMLVFPAFGQGSMDGSSQGSMGSPGSGGPGAGGNQGSQQRPEMQELPTPTEAELSLLQLNSLSDVTLSDPSLAITKAQSEVLIPILEEWKASIDLNPQADIESYTDGIAAILTDAQNLYLPVPPNGREGGPNDEEGPNASGNGPSDGGPAGNGPSDGGPVGNGPSDGGPSDKMLEPMDVSFALIEIIEKLTLL